MVELCEDAEDVGVGEESPLCVFDQSEDRVFNSHLGGSVPHLWEPQAHFFWRTLKSLCEEVG